MASGEQDHGGQSERGVRASSLLFALVIVSATAGTAPAMTQSEVESRLACQCGCGLTVQTCDHLQCSFGVPVKEDITSSLAAGETGEEIIARYVAEYGEKVLSAPTRKGFNLVAWYGPYLALILGAVVVLVAVRRMSSARETGDKTAGNGEPLAASRSSALQDQLHRELEELER